MIDGSVGTERRARDAYPEPGLEPLRPSAVSRSGRARPALGGFPLEDQVGRHEAASGLEEPAEERTRDGVGRVGDDPKGLPREPQAGSIGLDNGDLPNGESLAQISGASRMEFDRHDAGACSEEGGAHRACSRADVEDQFAAANVCLGYQAISPVWVELVPPPPPGTGGHGGP